MAAASNQGTLICYKLNHLSPNKVNKFCREFHGYICKSKFSQYIYKKEGFMSKIPHISPNKTVLVVAKENGRRVLGFLRRHGAKVFARKIILTSSDSKALL